MSKSRGDPNVHTNIDYATPFMYKNECFNFHIVGHLARKCKLKWVPRQSEESSSKGKGSQRFGERRRFHKKKGILNMLKASIIVVDHFKGIIRMSCI